MEFLTLTLAARVHLISRGKSAACGAVLAAALAFVLICGSLASAQSEAVENALKAAYLSKFALYVDWPINAFASSTSTINLCVVGKDPFGERLDKAVADVRADNRSMTVRRLKTAGPDSGCHIVYIGVTDRHASGQITAALQGSPVLSVGDSDGAVAIINFVIKDNRVRFDIDVDAAAQNGLNISSKLLSLALNVKRK